MAKQTIAGCHDSGITDGADDHDIKRQDKDQAEYDEKQIQEKGEYQAAVPDMMLFSVQMHR